MEATSPPTPLLGGEGEKDSLPLQGRGQGLGLFHS